MRLRISTLFLLGGVLLGGLNQTAMATPMLEQTAPTPTTYTHLADFSEMLYSPIADVTASVQVVDLGTTSGCQASDFTEFTSGSIALMERGSCLFETKAENAAAAGAVGALIMNDAIRSVLFVATLGADYNQSIPVFSLPYGLGSTFAGTDGLVVRMFNDVPPPSVPIPSTLVLMGLGLAGIGYKRHKQTKGA